MTKLFKIRKNMEAVYIKFMILEQINIKRNNTKQFFIYLCLRVEIDTFCAEIFADGLVAVTIYLL